MPNPFVVAPYIRGWKPNELMIGASYTTEPGALTDDTEQVAPRRAFMKSVGVGAITIAATAIGVRAGAEPLATTDAPDEAWLQRLNGKHRQYFDAISANDGWGLVFAANYLDMNMKAYNLKQSDITTVVGLRHMSVPLALNDAMWHKYKLGDFFKITDKSTHAPAARNVFSHLKSGDLPMPDAGIQELMARGVIFTVCNMALTAMSGVTASAAGLPAAGALKEWTANLIPGVVVVPAGVLAVNRAQEHKCTYCFAG